MITTNKQKLHKRPTQDVMLMVCLALAPGAIIQSYFFGYGVIINLIFASSIAISIEALMLFCRGKNIAEHLKDNSALVTGLLLGLALPSTLPLWMTFIGVSFAIIFAKHLYGGLGHNPFNPAMVGYVLLLISFPVEMTLWLPTFELQQSLAQQQPSIYQSLELIVFSQTSNGLSANDFRQFIDGTTAATPLDYIKTQRTLGKISNEILPNVHLVQNIHAWFWINCGFLMGGLLMLLTKTIRWQIPAAVLAGIVTTSGILQLYDSSLYNTIGFHLTTGATMLGAFFIATDPVSASTTPRGRLIFGFSIGFLVVIIRTFGGYPEAMAFAVLLLNITAPTIDHYTQPIIYGYKENVVTNLEH
jgi:Na+-translocating ferredoxin:NAD+ oxidoreductase subunit D